MSCFVKQIKSCEIFGDTINSRIFSFDISVKKVNALIQKNDSLNITHKILEINDNKHILNIEDLNLIIGNYKITYIFEILINGKQIKKTFCIEELVIKKAGCNCNEVINELNFIINLEEINIPVNIDLSITNINGQGGDLSWGNINGNIENQADLIQKFGDYYTKPQSDARFKSISYTPNWSEVSGKPTTFTPSAHTHTIAEIDNLQNTLANKVDKVIGKQLSTEDYTTAEKNKLAGIQEGAEANVNADWNATSGDAEILNKPTSFPPSLHTHTITDVVNLQTTLDSKEPIISTGTTSQYWRGDKTWQPLDKNAVGLNNVDNTSDVDKPISTATQNALNLKLEVGDISGQSPIHIDSGGVGNNLQIKIYKADATTNGYLLSTDWNTFNDKQNALGFTPENIANKATDFTTSNDTLYPSVKAVKDQLYLKQKKLSVITITGNTTLSEIHNGAILHIINTCNITIPTGLGANFACDCYVKGAFIAKFVNSGVTLNAPSGLLLNTDKMATLYSNASDTFNLLGELATS